MDTMTNIFIMSAQLPEAEALRPPLEEVGYKVFTADNVDAALHLLGSVSFGAMVFDLNLLGEKFSAFYQQLGANPTWVRSPWIFLAGTVEASSGKALEERGDGKTFSKPINWQELMTYLGKVAPAPPSTVSKEADSLGLEGAATASFSDASPPSNAAPAASLNAGSNSNPPSGPSFSDSMSPQSVDRMIDSLMGRTIGSVVIQKEIGRGGMGAVFAGMQTSLNRKVAVKIMLPGLVGDPTAMERFRREALAIARLKSPHIVQVFDAGVTPDKIFYIVMEFLEGETLSEHLKRHGQYPLGFALHITSQVAHGLHVAHQAGLIHRDIKPSNLMIDSNNHITITDFGLVRGFESGEEENQLTQARALLGTPSYLSPEQASAQPIDARSDIYSLGIVMYQMLVGRRPFVADNMLTLLMKQHSEPLPDPRQHCPDLPEPVVQLLYTMTAKVRDQRYPDCGALVQDLLTLLTQHGGANATPLLPQHALSHNATTGAFSPHSAAFSPSSISSLSDSVVGAAVEGEVLPSDFVKSLQLELAKQIGPIAKVAVKKEARALGFSRKQFPVDRAQDWIDRLAQNLEGDQREAFLAGATSLLQSLKG